MKHLPSHGNFSILQMPTTQPKIKGDMILHRNLSVKGVAVLV